MCEYVYIERRRRRVTVWFYDFGEKWLGHENPTFYRFCFIFHTEMTFSIHVFHLLYRWNKHSQKNLFWYYLVLKRNNHVVKNIYTVFIIVRELTIMDLLSLPSFF